jgi:TusA-related sulfurtransferase
MNNDLTPTTNLDLRGIACPLNFVKTKIQLEKMNSGDILEVLLDSGEAIESVPPSIKEEGHEVLEEKEIENYFKLVIRKN